MLATGDLLAAVAPLLLMVVAFQAFCIVDALRSPVRGLSRSVWIVVMLLSIPLGGVLYLLAGKDRPEPLGDTFSPTTAPPPVRVPTLERPTAPLGPAISTEGLRKTYGDRTALNGVALDVPAGSVYGLVGPNGAGKTTLIGILGGLRRASAGTATVASPRIAVMPDTPTFEAWLTAEEVVDLARHLSQPTPPRARVAEALAEVGMTEARRSPVGAFSRGMTQRLGIAASIVGAPDVLLLDEPCAALDPGGRRDVLDLVDGLRSRAAVLFSSHILADVERVCDTVGVLGGGTLRYQGPLGDLLGRRPTRAYLVEVRPPVAPVVAALRQQDFVVDVEVAGETLRVGVRSLDDAERGLAAALVAAGARIVRMQPAADDLEAAFLALTSPELPPPPDRRPA